MYKQNKVDSKLKSSWLNFAMLLKLMATTITYGGKAKHS